MGETTAFEKLAKIPPESETHLHELHAKAFRARAGTGDEAAAKTRELFIWEIRVHTAVGSSREIRYCPRCLERGVKYILIFMGGIDRCGTCRWPGDVVPPASES